MTTKQPNQNTLGQIIGEWMGELRKELKDIREEADKLASIEARAKIKIETIALEERLIEAQITLLTKTQENLTQLAKG